MGEPDTPELAPLEHPPYGFRCSRQEQNDFLFDRALEDQAEDISRTFLAYLDTIVVGFLTFAMDAIPLMSREKPRSDIPYIRLPALKLCHLAVHESREGRGLGTQLVALAMAKALELRQHVGCRYLTVDAATPRLVRWYQRQEFRINKLERKERERRAAEKGVPVDSLPTSMRLDLHHLTVDLQEHFPRDFPRD